MNNPFEAIEERLESIESLLRDLKQAHAEEKDPQPELIRRKEAQELLGGISAPTIISYEKKGYIKPLRIGGTILYDKAEIMQAKKK